MGLNVIAESKLQQTELYLELQDNGLKDDLRHCGILVWKSIFELCTHTDIFEHEWSVVPETTVHQFYIDSKQILESIPEDKPGGAGFANRGWSPI